MNFKFHMESNDQIFFLTEMPAFRPADFCLGYFGGSVFLDFKNVSGDRISLIRVSFDGYGSCDLESLSTPLTKENSYLLKRIVQEGLMEQDSLRTIVREAIQLNKEHIWKDAITEYQLN